jgi:hypothetical protein
VDTPREAGCDISDTGLYIYTINNNTLKFTLLSDSCPSRVETLTLIIFTAVSTEIKEFSEIRGLNIFPNPNSNGIYHINSEMKFEKYFIYDQNGRVVAGETKLSDGIIDIQNQPAGTYYLYVVNENGKYFSSAILIKD